MRISNCVDCGSYKYIEEKGKCRDCYLDSKIKLGINNRGNTNFINSESIYKGLNILGSKGMGKTTMAKNIVNQLVEDDHGLCYFTNKGDITESEINSQKTESYTFGPKDGFNVMNIIRDKKDIHYQDEIDMTVNIVNDMVKKNIDQSIFPVQHMDLLSEITEAILKLDKEYTVKLIYDCLLNPDLRKDVFSKSNYNFSTHKHTLIRNVVLDKNNHIIKSLEQIINRDEIINSIGRKKSTINISDIVKDSTSVILKFKNFIHSEDISLIAGVFSNKLLKEIEIQDNVKENKFVLCYDEIDRTNIDTNKFYSMGRKSNVGIINVIQSLSDSDKKHIITSGNVISFRINSKPAADSLSLTLLSNPNVLMNLDKYTYVAKKWRKTTFRGSLDI